MAFPSRTRAQIAAGLLLVLGSAIASAQTTQPASSAQRAIRPGSGPSPGSSTTAVPLMRGQSVRIARDGTVRVSNGSARQVVAAGDKPKYLDGVYRSVSDSPSPADTQNPTTTNNGANEQTAPVPLMGGDWYARWQAACGYGGFAPTMIYADDVVFAGGRMYGDTLEAGNRAGIDIGRRETLFKGGLDMYNERMGNPPAPSAGAADNGGAGYPYAVPPTWDAYYSGYRAGQYEGELWLARDRNLLRTARAYVAKGSQLFRDGKYEEAAEAFRLAGSSDHGDASCRLLAAHTYFAMGRYGTAMGYLRRAFQLQPKIAFLDYSLQAQYGDVVAFAKHRDSLKKACDANPNDYEAWTLLGYVYRHSGDRAASVKALARAYKVEPRDKLVRSLLDVEPDPKK